MRWMPHCVRRSRTKSATRVAMSVLSVSLEGGCREGSEPGGERDPLAAQIGLEEPAPRLRLAVEAAVRGEVAGHRLEEVPGPLLGERVVGLLGLESLAREQAVAEPGRDALAVHGFHGRPADDHLAARMLRRVDDR